MAKNKSIKIKLGIDIIVSIGGWLGDVINKISINPILHVFSIIKIRRTLFPSALALAFPGLVLGMSTKIQLGTRLG